MVASSKDTWKGGRARLKAQVSKTCWEQSLASSNLAPSAFATPKPARAKAGFTEATA